MAQGTEPRFVVIGTGRSGTGYISQALTAAGIRCGHENWWNPQYERVPDLIGDASWCALPHLPAYEGVVFQQVRDPLAVVASLVAVPDNGPYVPIRCQLVDVDPEELVRFAIASCLVWNEVAETYAVARWRLEDVDAGTIRYVGRQIDVCPTSVEAALDVVPKDYNRHNNAGDLGWSDLPDDPMSERLMLMAKRYGYG